ncbi:MAG: DUF2917 domain-containing protein [Burkholderiales bacterium]|nr:DUF2917 domain-containing protein [Burkholderiales bacterium]
MDMRTERVRIELDGGQTLRLQDAQGASVVVVAGEVWLTQEGDPKDVVLAAGEGHVVERGGLSVLQALDDARVTIVRAGAMGADAPGSSSSPAIRSPRRWYVGASNAA